MPPEVVTIEPRFCGPPDSANGGYACGRLAAWITGAAQVTLRRPPRLGVPLEVVPGPEGEVRLLDGDMLVAEAVPGVVDVAAPDPVSPADATRATAGSWIVAEPHRHAYPTCFVCGPDRAPGDGLRLFAAPVPGRDVGAAPWTPDASLGDGDGRVRPEFVWASLDCTSFLGAGFEEAEAPFLLGRHAVRIDERPRVGERCVVLGWSLHSEDRKEHCGAALQRADGEILAVARATWIRPRS